jgi:hypothetical protein
VAGHFPAVLKEHEEMRPHDGGAPTCHETPRIFSRLSYMYQKECESNVVVHDSTSCGPGTLPCSRAPADLVDDHTDRSLPRIDVPGISL